MKRRELLAASIALAAAACVAHAQQPERIYRIATISPSATPAELTDPSSFGRRQMREAMQERGYVEGRNLIVDRRTAEGVPGRIPDIVADLVRLKTEVIIVPHISIAQVAAGVTNTVPIVSASGDAIRAGLVQNLGRPGGNVTGFFAAGTTGVEKKRLELLREMVPNARRIAFVASKSWWDEWMGKAMNDAASVLGLKVVYIEGKAAGFGEAFAAVKREKPDAVFFEASATAISFRAAIGEFARSGGIPSACGHQEVVEAGCLMSYNFSNADAYRGIARYVDLILKGAKPGELPFEQYSKYEFVVNAGTAKAIRLTVPQAVLLRADRVIE
jgi:putative ABC transport system substrate-binding protein